MWTIPNILTIMRIMLLPVIIGLFFIPDAWAAWLCLGLYSVGAITDFIDGWIARTMNQTSAFGTFIDPIADKIFVAGVLVALVGFDRLPDLWIIPAIVILFREFLISGLREFLGPQDVKLPVSKLAKWKTTVQMFALGFLIVGEHGVEVYPYTMETGWIGISFAALLTVVTGWDYMRVGMKHIAQMDQK